MLHYKNGKVKNLLLKGNFGLEKENLRVTPDGFLSHVPHMFEDKHITRDFCENQLEINTPVAKTAEEAQEMLQDYTDRIIKKLNSLPERELLWPFSNPPFIKSEKDIPIAQFQGEEEKKTRYREYLSRVYGRYIMTLSGIHVNYSFADELLKTDFALSGYREFDCYKNDLYLKLTRDASAFGWIVTVLTAASPLVDSSYAEKGAYGRTVFSRMASTRCSESGYWNYFTPYFCYYSIEQYAEGIQMYVDMDLISAASELYFPVRLKPPGENTLERLMELGADHIELRMVDLNPYEPSGINLKDLKFIQLFLVWLACTEHPDREISDQILDLQNFKNAAHYDLKTINLLKNEGEIKPIADAALDLLNEMHAFYRDFGPEVKEILDFETEKIIDPEKRYAWRVKREFEDGFVKKGLALAEEYGRSV